MKIIKNFFDYVDTINEMKNKKYSYGCAMLYFDFPKIKDIQEEIKDKDVYTKEGHGLEDEPHCTLLYGLHDDEIEEDEVLDNILEYFDKGDKIKLKLYNPSLFESEFDVFKFDVKQILEDEDGKDIYKKSDDILFKINKSWFYSKKRLLFIYNTKIVINIWMLIWINGIGLWKRY